MPTTQTQTAQRRQLGGAKEKRCTYLSHTELWRGDPEHALLKGVCRRLHIPFASEHTCCRWAPATGVGSSCTQRTSSWCMSAAGRRVPAAGGSAGQRRWRGAPAGRVAGPHPELLLAGVSPAPPPSAHGAFPPCCGHKPDNLVIANSYGREESSVAGSIKEHPGRRCVA